MFVILLTFVYDRLSHFSRKTDCTIMIDIHALLNKKPKKKSLLWGEKTFVPLVFFFNSQRTVQKLFLHVWNCEIIKLHSPICGGVVGRARTRAAGGVCRDSPSIRLRWVLLSFLFTRTFYTQAPTSRCHHWKHFTGKPCVDWMDSTD